MSRPVSRITKSDVQWSRLFSDLNKCVILFLIILLVSGCGQPQNVVVHSPTPTPTPDPKKSGYDLLNLFQPFTYLSNKMADRYKEEDIDFMEENQPALVKIAQAADQLSVSLKYSDAKSYMSKSMWSIIAFYSSIIENPTVDINSLLPVAQEGSAYFNLFVLEMRNLGHDLKTE